MNRAEELATLDREAVCDIKEVVMKLSLSTWQSGSGGPVPGELGAGIGKINHVRTLRLLLGDAEVEIWPANPERIRDLAKQLMVVAATLSVMP